MFSTIFEDADIKKTTFKNIPSKPFASKTVLKKYFHIL